MIRRAYVLVYSKKLGSREQVRKCIDSIQEVSTWRYDMPNCFYLISNYSADQIATAIHNYTGKTSFLVSEITANKQGWLSKETWYLINNKYHKPKK